MKTILKSALRGHSCLYSAALLAVSALSAPAWAQDTAPQGAEEEEAAGAIIVTGSRIKDPNLQSANPISVITGEDIFETGNISVGDQLNDLPQLRNTYSQQNGTRFLGIRGLNLVDLRGLGSQRTLVLVNGRRHVASDILNNAVSTDINTIPADLIERIDVLTGGASGVYGSDAVAGVVNFILKDNFDGIKARAQGGISTYGDQPNQFVSVLAGKNFAEGRGNVALALEFSHSGRAFASDRPNLRQTDAFVVTDTDPAGSDGVPDRTFYRDIRSATLSLGGMVAISQGANAPCGLNVSAFTCTYLFQPDGTLAAQTGTRIGIGPNGNFQGGNGTTNREGELITLAPDLKRYSANLVAHYEFSPAATAFLEAKYVRTEAFGSQSGPLFSQGTTLGDPGGRERIRLDNPYLSAQARTLLTQQFLATTVNPNGGALTPAVTTAINNGSFRFSLRRNWVDLGMRDEEIKRETFRIVGGLRGDFNDDWNYELSFNYGQHKEKNKITGNVNLQRYLLAIDSTRDASGNIVCRSKLNPAGTISYVTGDTTSDPRLAGDIAACVPLNPFGQGNVTQAMRDYVLVDSRAEGKITQFDILAFVNGDTSGFLNLPGGPIKFSFGGEYRRETNFYDLDDITQEGYAFYNAIPALTAPAFKVVEGYAEAHVPILRDKPGFEELSLHGSGRIAKYSGGVSATGTVYAYGAEAIWKPIQDITLRGSYSRSVRSPNLSELYSAQGQNFAPNFVDPCSARNIGTGSANRAANCAAAGAPAGYDFVYVASLETVQGGNPSLFEEKSDSWTFGGIFQPRFIPGLSLSVDYYKITVNDLISSVSAQQVANLCYDLPSTNNPFCGLFQRAGAGGGPAGEIPFQILEGSLLEASANFAKARVKGIDVNLAYAHTFDWGKLDLNAIWSHVIVTESFKNPDDPDFADRYNNELSDPTDQVNFSASLTHGKWKFGYDLRWIDGMYVNTYEDYNPLNGNPPENADHNPIGKYPSVWYHDVRVAYDYNDHFNFYLGVDNIFDKKPPFGLTGVGGGVPGGGITGSGGGSGIYDNRGRFFYAGIVAKF